MTSRERFLNACHNQPVDRPPVWVMRQAGRYLPEYRDLRAKHDFVTLVTTPDLATEVTLQPLRRFDLDAAILFSDILVVPEAMGLPYSFRDGGGIAMDFAIRSDGDFDRLLTGDVRPRLDYVYRAIRQVRKALSPDKALLGFAGSPWTLATYMIEGGSSKEFTAAKNLFHSQPGLFERLMERLTEAVGQYLDGQIAAGVDAVQIFDSWGGALPGVDYDRGSLQWIRRLVRIVNGRVPVILYARNTYASAGLQAESGIQVLSLDWTVDMAEARARLPDSLALQGNLDPILMETTPTTVVRETNRLLESMRGRPGYIVNLGHGIHPQAKIECMAALVETVERFR
ncbi:MAG: uroporphyrinogen decarboxylase [Opitutaceae bacterium]